MNALTELKKAVQNKLSSTKLDHAKAREMFE
jgi:hypothetical protein